MTPDLIADVPVLFVMAASPEYGPALRARITPLMTGVGPVEGGVQLAAALGRMRARPRLIVSLGSAGSARLEQGQVYQVSAVAWRDIDASAFGFPHGTVPFLDLPEVIALPHRLPGVPEATLSTGANVVTGEGYAQIAQDMVDMETYAHLRAATAFGIPLIGLRGISDGAHPVAGLEDWTRLLGVIDEGLAQAVDRLAAALADGTLTL